MDGTTFGRYQLVELLGRGGMGEVWRAHDTVIDRTVAIKTLLPHYGQDATFEQRFRREARAAARLENPHVVPIYDVGEIDGRLYVAMRLIQGEDLQTLLSTGPLDPDRAVHITKQIASALQAAHKAGLVHRDVKPSNILVGEDDFTYLIDFGIARAAGETGLTSTGATIGTWAYMAPERFSTGEIAPSSDIYALACVLYQSLTGHMPFPGTTLEQVAMAHMAASPPKPSAVNGRVPPALDAVVAGGLAKSPDQRYPTAKDLAQAATAALNTPPPPYRPEVSSRTPQSATVIAPPRRMEFKPSSQYRPPFAPVKGRWAKVVAVGDDHIGQVGQVVEVCEDDEDGFDVILEFRGDPDNYAFRRDELVADDPPAEHHPTPMETPSGEDFWLDVGIDPIRIVTPTDNFLTLRCYLDKAPIFLGSNGRIAVFRSGRALQHYLATRRPNDMSTLSTYRDVEIAAINGSLPAQAVTEDNIYVLKGLAEDIGLGPDRIDRAQMELAVELLSDVGEYVGSTIVDRCLQEGQPLGELVNAVLNPAYVGHLRRSRGDALSQWTQLEDFLESRLRAQ